MSGWIKFWKDMPNDPRVLAAAAQLAERYILAQRGKDGCADLPASEAIALCRNAVTGALATLWSYADEHIRDDDTLPLTSQTIDSVVGIEGFFDLLPRDWLDELEDGRIVLPGYCEKNSLISKRKRTINSNARVTRWRRSNKVNGNGVTHRRVTHDNESRNAPETKTKTDTKKKEEEARGRALSVTGLDLQAWESWISYRAQRKPAIKTTSLVAAAEELAGFGNEQGSVVKHSIANGYQGLFAPKAGLNGKHPEDTGWRPSK